MIIRTAALAAVMALTACGQQEPAKTDTAAIQHQLQVNEARWNKAYQDRDGKALAAMYADDAALANPGEHLLRGKEAIGAATASYASDPKLKVAFRANRIQVAQSGDLAYTRGNYTMTMTNPATRKAETSAGHYLTVWQKQSDGSWKAVEDFITPGKELAPAQAAAPIL